MVTWAARAASFGGVADVYERSRPGYPAEAVTWLVGDDPARVLDVGAGTGKLTTVLVEAGHEVAAVDPAEPMLTTLRANLPQVDACVGTAEAIPAADASFDVVTVAQAFHWFDPSTAIPEIARVLRPGGRLALVWNLRDESVPWVRELWAVIAPDEPRIAHVPEVLPGGQFGPVEHARFSHVQRLDRDAALGLALSRSYVAVRSPDQRAELLDAAGAILDRHSGADGWHIPYVTHCFRTTRL